MKDLVTKTQKNSELDKKDIISAAILHLVAALIGFTASRGVILNTLMPFGLIFTGSCTTPLLPSVATGAFIGYFIPAINNGGFRYIAALFAVIAIRILLSGYKKLSENPFFLSVVTTVANVFTGLVAYSGAPAEALKLAVECIIILGCVFLTHKTFSSFFKKEYGLMPDEIASLMITLSVILIGFNGIEISGISIGRILSVTLILVAAKYGELLTCTLCGVAVTFCCALTSSFEGGYGIYALAGVIVGVFSSLGKYVQVLSFISTAIIGLTFVQFKSGGGIFLAEIIIGCLLFIILPRNIGIYLSKFFYRYPNVISTADYTKALELRLNVASDALCDVSDTICRVSSELSKINAPDFNGMLSLIEQDACGGCKLRMHCWENKSDQTAEAVMQMIDNIKCNTSPEKNPLSDEFKGRCLRVKNVENAVKNRYSQYASKIAAENRIYEVRSVVSEQFEGISDMLKELACNLSDDERLNGSAAEIAVAALNNLGIQSENCSAKIDKFGRMSLEIKIKVFTDTVINRLQIMKMLSLACERDFDVPSINKSGNFAVITVSERPNFKVDIGVDQRSAITDSICGDAYKYFNDGKGHFVMVLSDGMGTGGRAAVDGTMASGLMAKLIKAGLGYNCALKLLNSSMLFKSSDESLATMDIASIDLFSGKTELYKAGAAATVVRRNGKSGRAESQNLPIGIIKDISFDRAGIRLKAGDILLLMSDGVTFDGTEWIRNEVENWSDGSAQNLAEHICAAARRRYTDSRADDITVMAAIIEKNM